MDFAQDKTLAAQCFENPVIVKCILQQSSWGSMRNLKLRLINKTFDSEMLRRIRLGHRTIRIETPDAHRNRFEFFGPNQLIEHIDVNFHRIHTPRAGDYFKFLIEVARVKLDELVLVNCWALETEGLKVQLHTDIHDQLIPNQPLKVFIGIDDICVYTGCCQCQRVAKKCAEYGPAQIDYIFDIDEHPNYHHHYSKFKFSEEFIGMIAMVSAHEADNREECMRNMKTYIPRNLSCDHFTITVSESQIFLADHIVSPQPHPREVLEEMCKVWRVKRLRFEFDFYPRTGVRGTAWVKHGYFTEFKFHNPISEEEGKLKLEHVEVDLTKTNLAFEHAIDGSIEVSFGIVWNLIITNIRQVFGARHVSIKGDYKKRELNESTLENMLKACWKEHDRRLEVSISMVICTDKSDYEMGDSFELLDRYFECSVLDGRLEDVTKMFDGEQLVIRKYSGRAFRILDTYSRCVLNLKLFVDSEDLEKILKDSEDNKGLLRFFFD